MSKIELTHGKDYFSPSQLKKLFVSIGAFKSYLSREYTSSKQMDLGTAVHMMLLEPLKYSETYVYIDDSEICSQIGGKRPTATKLYAEWYEKILSENVGKVLLSKEQVDILEKIKTNCDTTGVSDTFFTDGEAEKTVTGVASGFDEDFDALCIIDYDTDFMSIDLKTTSKPLSKFKWDANDLGYDIQAAVTKSINNKDFVFVVVQTVAPYDIGVFTTSEYFMNRGVDKVNTALNNYKFYSNDNCSQVLTFEL